MFRAIVGLLFIVIILPLAALIASLVMNALGASGLLGVIVGLPVFFGILTLSIMTLAAINDRINYRDRDQKSLGGTHTNSAH